MTIKDNPDLISHYQSQAQVYLQTQQKELEKISDRSSDILKNAAQSFPVTANVVISILGIGYVTVVVTMTIEGKDIKFNGTGGGVIVGAGGISFTAGVSGFSRAKLEGQSMNFNLNLAPTGITIMIDQELLGPKVVMTGPGPNVGVGIATGKGEWT
jgi:hypothetical protein